MPKRIQPLSDIQVKNAKPKDKDYKLSDGFGLYLLITPSGGKLWRMQYRFIGKQKLLSFGSYPHLSISEARQRREDAKKLLANGFDPGAVKKAQRAALLSKQEHSFEVIARMWHAGKVEGWAESHSKTTMERMEKNLFPWLGKMLVSEIKLSDIKPILHRIEDRAPESARRMYVVLNMIFRFCVASDLIMRNPFEGLKPSDIMRREPIEKHYPAITDPKVLTSLLFAIDDFNGSFVVKCALQLAPLVFVRPGELRHAEWSEINFDSSEWNIPVEKMKLSRKEKSKRKGDFHCVPLCRQANEILKALQPLTGRSPYVFPSARSYLRPMSEAALTAALHRMGYKGEMTWHGFRASARTILDEVLHFRTDYIEHQLAHAVRDPLGRAYNRTTHLAERTTMMQAWGDYLDQLKKKL